MGNIVTNVISGVISGAIILLVEYMFLQPKRHPPDHRLSTEGKPEDEPPGPVTPDIPSSTEAKSDVEPPGSATPNNSTSSLTTTSSSQTKNPFLSAILSYLLLGGGGQIYLGQIRKGITLIVITLVTAICGAIFVVNILGAIDAYRIAKRFNAGEDIGEWEFALNRTLIFISVLVTVGIYAFMYIVT